GAIGAANIGNEQFGGAHLLPRVRQGPADRGLFVVRRNDDRQFHVRARSARGGVRPNSTSSRHSLSAWRCEANPICSGGGSWRAGKNATSAASSPASSAPPTITAR